MNVHHFAWQTSVGQREFRCWRCGYTSLVTIRAQGAAQASTYQAGSNAAALARKGAGESAAAWIDVHLRFAACPRCGAHDEVQVATLKRRSLGFVIGGVVALALGAAGCYLGANLAVTGLAVGGVVLAFVGLLFAIIGALQPGMVLSNAKRAVVFESPPQPPAA
ncbi:MAG: hypothetical protein NVSMB47_17200 [Polyangiales bacterium]